MKVLVTGKNGQLGSEIRAIENEFEQFNFLFTDSKELNISNKSEVDSFFSNNTINAVINCAAYTAVDKAEEEHEKANSVNHLGIKHIADMCKKHSCKLIHISTDYVFDGESLSPYKEVDSVNPKSEYGKTKLAGEKAVLDVESLAAVIVRTSWVYSGHGTNFVKTMLRLAKDHKVLKVVDDQIGSPTFAKDLAKVCLDILNTPCWSKQTEIYHYSNEGSCSWCEFAEKILEFKSSNCKVLPISTKEYPTLAPRPSFSVFNKSKIKDHFNIEINTWQESLKQHLSNKNV
ncbi:MAG: dTDP-4-dehydrorhamnose reductase [Crocinitomicaceae bacterium]